MIDNRRRAFAQRERDAQFFLLGTIDIRPCCRYISLVAIEERNLHGDFRDSFPAFCEGRAAEHFVVVLQSAADLNIRSSLPPSSAQHRLGASFRFVRNSNGRALFRDRFDGFFFIYFRPAFFQVTGHCRQRKPGLPDHCRERAPLFAQRVLLHPRAHAHSLCFHFYFEHFGFVGLAGVH